MRLYDGKCAITGDEPAEVLEAAHIEPHAVRGRNSLDNGLLLRSDIHALFDDGLLWIEPDSLTVSITLKLRSTTYAGLEGRGLRPRIDGSVPNRQLLTDHMRNARTDA
jgi:predicted restriction endonuclease